MVDWHDVSTQKCGDWEMKEFTNNAIKFFSAVMNKYKGSPNIILEFWNEPGCDWKIVKKYHYTLLWVFYLFFNFLNLIFKAIRQIDPNFVAILGCPLTCENVKDPVYGTNIM